MAKSKTSGLEQSFKRVAEIVTRLEQNDCSLEESLKLYEEGVILTRSAHQMLSEAQRKIEQLKKIDAAGPIIEPYEGCERTIEKER